MEGSYGTRDGRLPATTATTGIVKPKLGDCSSTSTSGHLIKHHVNNQLGGEASPCIQLSIFFPFMLYLVSFMFKKMCKKLKKLVISIHYKKYAIFLHLIYVIIPGK
jgi:hypothetical protein